MAAYYNEIDQHAAAQLRELINRGLIAPGDVDERSITEVRPNDVRQYNQCHFFAGIGGWSRALRLAEWPDDRPIWTGSCPCQPFSVAGSQRGSDDVRHLWPAFFALIRECRPATVFGEQVAGASGYAWWDHVAADLESEAYAAAACDIGAHSVGSAHVRQRLYWMADGDSTRCGRKQSSGLFDGQREAQRNDAYGCSFDVLLGNANSERLERRSNRPFEHSDQQLARPSSPWGGCEWIACTDGKKRPIERGVFPLAYGLPEGLVRGGNRSLAQDANSSAEARIMRLRGYGNAIVPHLAAEFIRAAMFVGPVVGIR